MKPDSILLSLWCAIWYSIEGLWNRKRAVWTRSMEEFVAELDKIWNERKP